jgi:hypothetical protein
MIGGGVAMGDGAGFEGRAQVATLMISGGDATIDTAGDMTYQFAYLPR